MWVRKVPGGARIEVDRDALSALLIASFAKDVDAAARTGAAAARSVLPAPDMRDRVRVRTHDNIQKGKGVGGNRFAVDWKKGSPKDLMHKLEVPVALITVDSKLAAIWEYGRVSKSGKPRKRPELWAKHGPLRAALTAAKGKHYFTSRGPVNPDGSWS